MKKQQIFLDVVRMREWYAWAGEIHPENANLTAEMHWVSFIYGCIGHWTIYFLNFLTSASAPHMRIVLLISHSWMDAIVSFTALLQPSKASMHPHALTLSSHLVLGLTVRLQASRLVVQLSYAIKPPLRRLLLLQLPVLNAQSRPGHRTQSLFIIGGRGLGIAGDYAWT